MNDAFKRSIIGILAVFTLFIAIVTTLAMVIAPACSGIQDKAGAFKIASLCIFLPAFYVLAWRKQSMIAAVLIPAFQIATGMLFANYINSLPLGCPQ